MVAAVGRDQFAALGLVRVLPVVKPLLQGLHDGFALADFVLLVVGRGRRQPSFRYDKRRLLSAAVVSALGHFVPKYQPMMKSRRANLAECSLSTSHSAMAGTPKGETRNARTRNTIPPTVCPPMNRIRESSVSTMQPSSHTADATQKRNVTIAASRDSATITGAARILRTIIAATSIKKSGWSVLLPILYRWENRHTRMSSFHRFGRRCPLIRMIFPKNPQIDFLYIVR